MSITASTRLPRVLAALLSGLLVVSSLLATAPSTGAATHAKKAPEPKAQPQQVAQKPANATPAPKATKPEKPPKPPKPPKVEKPPQAVKPERPPRPEQPPRPPKPEKPAKPVKPKPVNQGKPNTGKPNQNQGNVSNGAGAGAATSTPTAPATAPVAVPSSPVSAPAVTPAAGKTGSTRATAVKRKQVVKAERSESSAGSGAATSSSMPPAGTTPAATSSSGERGGSGTKSDDGSRRPSVITKFVKHVPEELRLAIGGLSLMVLLLAGVSVRERLRSTRALNNSFSDPLTGVANRSGFERRMASEVARAARYGRPLGVLMLDLNDFKEINDSNGHAEGDRVLQEAAGKMVDRVRETDLVARIGGDEFVIVCPETDEQGLMALAASLRSSFAGIGFGASVGYAEFTKGQSEEELLASADASMYADKRRIHAVDTPRPRLAAA